MPVARLPRQGKCRVVMGQSLFPPTENGLHVTESIAGLALDAPIAQFPCHGQRGVETCAGGFEVAFLDSQQAEAYKCTALASAIPGR